MKEGFFFENAGAALEFYEECERVGATTFDERLAVMRRLVKEKKTKYLRDVDTFAKDYRVLRIKSKETPNA